MAELFADGCETLLDGAVMSVKQRVALVVVDTGFVGKPPRGSLLQRFERGELSGAVNPGQRKVFLPPCEHPPGARIELVDIEGRPVERSRRRERRHGHETEIEWRTQLLQRRATDHRHVDARLAEQLEHLLVTLVEHCHSQMCHTARLPSALRELRRGRLRLAHQIARAGATSTTGVNRRLDPDRAQRLAHIAVGLSERQRKM